MVRVKVAPLALICRVVLLPSVSARFFTLMGAGFSPLRVAMAVSMVTSSMMILPPSLLTKRLGTFLAPLFLGSTVMPSAVTSSHFLPGLVCRVMLAGSAKLPLITFTFMVSLLVLPSPEMVAVMVAAPVFFRVATPVRALMDT